MPNILITTTPSPSDGNLGEITAPLTLYYAVYPEDNRPIQFQLYEYLDNNLLYDSGKETTSILRGTKNIDPRKLGEGKHEYYFYVKSFTTGYSGAEKSITFTVPKINLPDKGKGFCMQDELGNPLFPQTISPLVEGINNKSVAKNLQELENKIETGSYTGTGTYGANNPNIIITFNVEWFIIVSPDDDIITIFNAHENSYVTNGVTGDLMVGSNFVSWSSTSAVNQRNVNGRKYYYTIIHTNVIGS